MTKLFLIMSIIFMLVLYISAVNADNTKIHDHLMYSFSQCIDRPTTVRTALSQLYVCWKTSLYKCVQRRQAPPSLLIEHQPICGVLQSGIQVQPAVWTCKVYHGFAIYVDFLEFYLPCSTNCAKASLYLTYSDTIAFHYCGKRQPWGIGVDASLLQIKYKQLSYTYRSFHFSLTYEAVDIKSPLVSVTQISHVALDVAYQIHFLTFGNVYSYSAYIAHC